MFFHLLKNMVYVLLLVLKGIYHWTYFVCVCIFQGASANGSVLRVSGAIPSLAGDRSGDEADAQRKRFSRESGRWLRLTRGLGKSLGSIVPMEFDRFDDVPEGHIGLDRFFGLPPING